MKTIIFRLRPGDDLKAKISRVAEYHQIKAGFVLTCVGSLNEVTVRMAGAKPEQQDIRTFVGHHEIVSLVGTLSEQGNHLHISFSDKDGNVYGGHLKEGSIVDTTAEIVIGHVDNLEFAREVDKDTGFEELAIKPL